MTSTNAHAANGAPLRNGRQYTALPLIIGAVTVVAFAPLQWFIIALITPGLLERFIHQQTAKTAALRSFLFGLGFFGAGISWVFLSIHNHSDAPLWAALLITLLFVSALSGVLALMGASYGAITRRLNTANILIFPLMWVLFEWMRTWLFTGFPWLLLGYSLIDTPFQSFAPLFGVYGLSFICVLTSVLLNKLFSMKPRQQMFSTAVICALCLIGFSLQKMEWTQPEGEPKIFGLVQGNIPQEIKWDPRSAQQHLTTYRNLTEGLGSSHIVVWPEAAFPYSLPQGRIPIIRVDNDAQKAHQALITGVVIDNNDGTFTNSMIAVGEQADGRYDKYHLVPFGEFVPFRDWLGSTFDWLQLPMSFTVPGEKMQRPLEVQGLLMTPLICYEIVYPELSRLRALESDVLLTISNDTWFGRSLGPIQHMQMARMRALENGRMLVRATNNGITAITDHKGNIRHQAPSDQATVLTGLVQGYSGHTPIMRMGHHNLLRLMAILLVGILCNAYFRRKSAGLK